MKSIRISILALFFVLFNSLSVLTAEKFIIDQPDKRILIAYSNNLPSGSKAIYLYKECNVPLEKGFQFVKEFIPNEDDFYASNKEKHLSPKDIAEDFNNLERFLICQIHRMRNFSLNDAKNYILSANGLGVALNKSDFKDRLLELTFTENNELSNEKIYEYLKSGRDKFNVKKDFDIDIDVTLYNNPDSNVIGFTYPNTWRTWINKKYLDSESHKFLAGHILHEYLHNMGFNHYGEHSTSVPYQLGELVRRVLNDEHRLLGDTLDLRNKGITAEKSASIVGSLSNYRTVFLNYNEIGDEGVLHIAKILSSNTTIQELYLDSNKISDKGVNNIAEALSNNKTLHLLALSQNNITDEGVTRIAEALSKNKALRVLTLLENNITDKGIESINNALKINDTITIIKLPGKTIDRKISY